MSNLAIKVENLDKQYRLGIVSTGTLVHDLNRWWYKTRGKADPYEKVTTVNDRTQKGGAEYVWSLKDINFEVKQGDVVGIIGRNGAGKSTLLKILSKITSPTSGTVKINGRIASLLEVGTGFHPELTGRENIFLNGAILGMKRNEIKSKFDEIVDFAGVELYIDTPVKRYSSGMHLRLAFAVAAHLESEILIVDEVLAVGDAEFQKKCLGKMGEVSKGEGRTVLFVSHNMAAVQNLCNRGILLTHGNVGYDGEVEQAIRAYNKSVVSLLQSSSVVNRKDRSGNQTIKLTSFQINNIECNDVVQIECNKPIKFDLYLQSKEDCNNAKVVIGVYDEGSNRVLFIDSESELLKLNYKAGENKLSISLPSNFSLGIGQYTINVAIYNNIEIVDYMQQVAVFEILDGDFYGNSKNVVNNAKVLIKTDWKLYE
jgi:lipopolysaccharide transport system ATP-binding protein